MTTLCPRCGHAITSGEMILTPTVEDLCRQALTRGERLPSLTRLQVETRLSRHTVIKRRRAFLQSLAEK